jgi:hypothetical protein
MKIIAFALTVGMSAAAVHAQTNYVAVPLPPDVHPVFLSAGSDADMSWNTIDSAGRFLQGGAITIAGTVGQADPGIMVAGDIEVSGGFWSLNEAAPCYANCDKSTAAPILNVNDFQCFMTKFAQGDSYANCDSSTIAPALNILDFQCFLNKFALGCPG